MKKLTFLIIIIIISFQNIHAALVTWNGGTGDWDVAANWDSNTVPGAVDEVIIPNGSVTIPDGYSAFATRVELQSLSSEFFIGLNATLTLDGVIGNSAVDNNGTFTCRGDLIIGDVSVVGNGIYNRNVFKVTANGRVQLKTISSEAIYSIGIFNTFENRGIIKVLDSFLGSVAIRGVNTSFLNTGTIEITAESNYGIILTDGDFRNKGSMLIEGPVLRGIDVAGVFQNLGNGDLTIKNISGDGILTKSVGQFKNQGKLTINNTGAEGIINFGAFNNLDTIQSFGGIFSDGIINYGSFKNKVNGVINLNGYGNCGITNDESGVFKNEGRAFLDGQGTSFCGLAVNSGLFKNKDDASLTALNHTDYNIQVFSDATLRNSGVTISFNSSATGVFNNGTIVNESIFRTYNNFVGFENDSLGFFKTKLGLVIINDNGSTGLINHGEFVIKPCAVFDSKDQIDNQAGSIFKNQGIYRNNFEGTHLNAGTMTNTGAIQDPYESMLPVMMNNGVILTPLVGLIEVGIPYSNALQVGNLNNITIGDWILDLDDETIAGTYDQSTNEFTANAVAVGENQLYINILLINENCSIKLFVDIEDAIKLSGGSAMTGQNDPWMEETQMSERTGNRFSEFKVFPNPAHNYLEINTDVEVDKPTKIILYNSLGQIVEMEKLSVLEKGNTRINFNQNLNTGIYHLEVQTDDEMLHQERVFVIED